MQETISSGKTGQLNFCPPFGPLCRFFNIRPNIFFFSLSGGFTPVGICYTTGCWPYYRAENLKKTSAQLSGYIYIYRGQLKVITTT